MTKISLYIKSALKEIAASFPKSHVAALPAVDVETPPIKPVRGPFELELVRKIAAAMDEKFYREETGAILPDDIGVAEHYLAEGVLAGLPPSPNHMEPLWHALAAAMAIEELPEAMAFWRGYIPGQYKDLMEAFDPGYYARASGRIGSPAFLLAHYLCEGWIERLDPSEDFNTGWYLDMNADVRNSKICPLPHYVVYGWRESRTPRPDLDALPRLHLIRSIEQVPWNVAVDTSAMFDDNFYLENNPKIAEAGIDPLAHYLRNGWREWRDPAPNFSVRFYITRNVEVRLADINPLIHYITVGRAAGLRTSFACTVNNLRESALREVLAISAGFLKRVEDAFNVDYYLRNYPDVVERGFNPVHHYLVYGWREGRDPSPTFSTNGYLEANADIAAASINPFVHSILFGAAESRSVPQAVTSLTVIDKTAIDEAAIAAVPLETVEICSPFVDKTFYVENNPEVAGFDPTRHYLAQGWKRGLDPSPAFSTNYYLQRYPDIAKAGIPPLLHYAVNGRSEGRETVSYVKARKRDHRPLVSAIVPNYNHARYIEQRLRSIDEQTWRDIEIIVLDDCSTDDSRDVIERVSKTLRSPVKLVFNDENAGNVFAQWRKGISLAKGELIWICESDDFCENDFLERMVPHFADVSVQLAFGAIQFAKSDGTFMKGLDDYREGAEPGIWDAPLVRPAAEWFAGGFGVNNVMANVGGCLLRRMELADDVWEQARKFKICGDWYLYIQMAGGGQIAFEPNAVAYFRQHDKNTSATNFDKEYYYRENMAVLRELIEVWGIPLDTRHRFLDKVRAQWLHFGLEEKLGDFDVVLGTSELLKLSRRQIHVQLLFLGFHPGGGEFFPINLANAMLRQGLIVSMMAVDMTSINERMLESLDRRIAVYHACDASERGLADYLKATGVTLLHSHMVACEAFLVELDPNISNEVPLVVTLHGSYVAIDGAPEQFVRRIINAVDCWVYTADRNLDFFQKRGLSTNEFIKMPNAMPYDPRPASFSRADLGIAESDVVFTLVARGIKRKGWRAAISAFQRLREVHGRQNVHLLMIGEGEAEVAARKQAEGVEGVHFLGFQSEIGGVFRMSDVVILPTRFEGESYPLIIIQALQEGRPVVATDIGEIRAMLTSDAGDLGGVLLPKQRDSKVFFSALERAMLTMLDADARTRAADVALELAVRYDLDQLTENYINIYKDVIEEKSKMM